MKKLSLTIVLCLTIAVAFGQKRAISDAKKEIGNTNPNFEDARNLIKGAKENPETMDNPETWYVAGLVENKQFDMERALEIFGKTPNETKMYTGLKNIMPNFIVADSLDMLPDAKGKVKPKYRKDMKAIMSANKLYYINGGAYFYDNKDYQTAYELFRQYVDIPKMNMFEGDDLAAKDTIYTQIKYYAAICLVQIGDSRKTIAAYQDLKNDGYKENEVFQYLCHEYELLKDTVNLIQILKEGVEKFPAESYFLLNLINQYIYTNQTDEAVVYLTKAIDVKPNEPQLYDVLGRIYENKKDVAKAMANFEKALSINPDFVESIGNLGRILFNQAVEAQVAANEISDNKKYQAAKAKANEMFEKALPYFEKAHQLQPDERDYMIALSRIYYTLNMGAKFDQMEKKLGN